MKTGFSSFNILKKVIKWKEELERIDAERSEFDGR